MSYDPWFQGSFVLSSKGSTFQGPAVLSYHLAFCLSRILGSSDVPQVRFPGPMFSQLLCSELFYVAKFRGCFQACVLTSSQFPRSSQKLRWSGPSVSKVKCFKNFYPMFQEFCVYKTLLLEEFLFFKKRFQGPVSSQALCSQVSGMFEGFLRCSQDLNFPLSYLSLGFRILSQCSIFLEPFIFRVQCFSRHYVLRFLECFKESCNISRVVLWFPKSYLSIGFRFLSQCLRTFHFQSVFPQVQCFPRYFALRLFGCSSDSCNVPRTLSFHDPDCPIASDYNVQCPVFL